MKLKNSHILLIVMSIFLLISIGSVCASDVAMDADTQLATDGSDNVVLANESSATQKIDTTVVSNNVKINEGETPELNISVKDNESKNINFTSKEITVNEGNKSIGFNYDNSKIIITNTLAAGNHSLNIKYLGNDNYANSSTNVILSIIGDYKLSTSTSVNVNSTNKVVIPIKLTDSVNFYDVNKDGLTLVLSYTENNKTVNKTISSFELIDGSIRFNYDININTSSLIIKYIHENKTLTSTVSLKKAINARITPINLEAEYASGNFTFQLIDIDTNKTLSGKKLSYTVITGSINTGGSVTTDANGIATIDNSRLTIYSMSNGTISGAGHIAVGTQAFSIKGDDSTISASEIKNNFTVTQANINIVVNPYKEYYGSDKKVVINVTNSKTGEAMKGIILHLNMPNTSAKDYYFQTDENGTSLINVSGLVGGTYSLTVSNNDTKNINYKNVSGSITILKTSVKISANSKTMYYNTGSTGTIKVTDSKTGKGVSGVYVLVQLFTGSKSTYSLLQTGSNGAVTFSAPLAVGSHKMVVSLADNRYSASSVTKTITVKKASAKISASKTTAYYKQGKYFVVTVKNTKNNKVIYGAKLNIKVYISSTKYYSYTGTTGANGKLSLKISYNPGTYKVVISKGESKNYTASSITTKIIVKKAPAKLTPTKLTAKKGANKYFKVTVKNTKTKKVIAGVKVKIKVYTGKSYKTYTVKTSAKGIAQISAKSLKVGTHKVVVTSANKYVTAKSATSSIKITK